MTALIAGVLLIICCSPVYATGQITGKINNLKDLVLGIIQSAGAIVLLWGIFEFATSYSGSEFTQQTNSLKKIVSGILMLGASTVVSIIG